MKPTQSDCFDNDVNQDNNKYFFVLKVPCNPFFWKNLILGPNDVLINVLFNKTLFNNNTEYLIFAYCNNFVWFKILCVNLCACYIVINNRWCMNFPLNENSTTYSNANYLVYNKQEVIISIRPGFCLF